MGLRATRNYSSQSALACVPGIYRCNPEDRENLAKVSDPFTSMVHILRDTRCRRLLLEKTDFQNTPSFCPFLYYTCSMYSIKLGKQEFTIQGS